MAGWLCQDCLSINKGGAGRCYKCHVPRKFGEAPDGIPDPTRSQGAGPGPAEAGARTRRPRPVLADYRSSRRRSWYLLALLTVTVGHSTLSLAMLQANGGTMGLAIRVMQRDLSVVGNLVAVSLIGLILTLATAIAWFVWFDRVLQNVPPLTGRWTELGRFAAVTWWLVPLVGLFRGPYVVGQVYDRVRVRTSPGLWLLGLWAITWLGGTIAPAIASRAIGFFPLDLVTMAQLDDAIGILGQVSYVVAGLFAAALVLAFEQAQEARSTGATDLEPHRVDDDARHGADGYSSPLPSAHGGPAQGTAAAWPAANSAATGGSWATAPSAPWQPAQQAWPPAQQTWEGYGGGAPQVAISSPLQGAPGAPIADAGPMTPGDPAAARGRFRIGVLPGIPLAVMGGAIVVGLVVGVLIGQSDRPAVFAADPNTPGAFVGAPRRPVAAPAVSTTSTTPLLTPFSQATVARDVVGLLADKDYRGGLDIRATLISDEGTSTSTLDVLRSGDREWSELHLGTTGKAAGDSLERVTLDSTVWERTDTGDWESRDRTGRDRPMAPLLGLTRPEDLSYVGVWPDGDAVLRAFRWENDMTAAERSLVGRLGLRDPIRTAATLLVTTAGEPVRSLLSYTGDADGDEVQLDVIIDFEDVMASILIRSPRAGPPALVQEP